MRRGAGGRREDLWGVRLGVALAAALCTVGGGCASGAAGGGAAAADAGFVDAGRHDAGGGHADVASDGGAPKGEDAPPLGSGDAAVPYVEPTATVLWTHDYKVRLIGGLALSDEVVYVVTRPWENYGLPMDPGDSYVKTRLRALAVGGGELWAAAIEGHTCSAPAVDASGSVIVGTNLYFPEYSKKGLLYRYSPTGEQIYRVRFEWELGATIRMGLGSKSIAVDGGNVAYVVAEEILHAVDPDGSIRWTLQLGQGKAGSYAQHDASVTIANGRLYVVSAGFELFVVGMHGELIAKTPLKSKGYCCPPVPLPGGSIAVIGFTEGLNVYSQNGLPKWNAGPLAAKADGCPTVGADGTVYIGYASLYAARDGQIRWTRSLSLPKESIDPKRGVTVTEDGKLVSLSLSRLIVTDLDGNVLAMPRLPYPELRFPGTTDPAVSAGRVLYGSDTAVVMIEAPVGAPAKSSWSTIHGTVRNDRHLPIQNPLDILAPTGAPAPPPPWVPSRGGADAR